MTKEIRTLVQLLLRDAEGDMSALREGLDQTPDRFLRAWDEYTHGYRFDDQSVANLLTTFEDGVQQEGQIIVQTNIPVYSLCEHHLAPFFGVVHIAYIPHKRIVGLSKLKRLVDVYAKRLQVQERLTDQIAHALQMHLNSVAVGVVIQCRHLCMEMRGIRTPGTVTTTSAMHGLFRHDSAARAELLTLMRLSGAAAPI